MRNEHDGWVTLRAMLPPLPGVEGFHFRMGEDDDGRPVVSEIYIHGDQLTAETLRRISIPQLESLLVAGDPAYPPGARADDSDLTLGELRASSTLRKDSRSTRRRWRLTRPDGQNPDDFYRRVAVAYNDHRKVNRAPSKGLADEAGVPVTTAHRWVREARRRGFLPPGRKGKAG